MFVLLLNFRNMIHFTFACFRPFSLFSNRFLRFLAQGEHAKSSNGVVVLAKPIVPRENQAGNESAHITGRVRDAAPVAPPEPIPKLF